MIIIMAWIYIAPFTRAKDVAALQEMEMLAIIYNVMRFLYLYYTTSQK